MSEINAEFGSGTALSAYRGATWYTDAGSSGTFPALGAISMDAFYDKRKNTPAVGIDYLIVGGGGGGGAGIIDSNGGGGGGGGGGGYYTASASVPKGTSIAVTVGLGGAGGTFYRSGRAWYGTGAGDGTSSSVFSYVLRPNIGIISMSGGASGAAGNTNVSITGIGPVTAKGGDGGGGGPPFSNAGGAYSNNGGSDGVTAGGGGGGTDDQTNVWRGGDGPRWLDGNYYSGGGSGGGDYDGGAAGGAGGGGHGGYQNTDGTDGLGGGGGGGGSYGGSSYTNGSRGGNGVVIFRYPGSTATATGGTITYSGGYVYHTFTSNGTFAT